MDNLGSNKYSRFKFLDPELQLLHTKEPEGASAPFGATALATAPHEVQDAAVFCYLLGQRQGMPVFYTRQVSDGCDFVAAWSTELQTHFCPVQIRHPAVATDGSRATLQEAVDSLPQAYPDSPGLVVVLHLDPASRCVPSEVVLPRLNIAGLWVFGAVPADGGQWCLWGDFLGVPTHSLHSCPGT